MSSEIVKTAGAPAITNMDDLARVGEMLSKSGYFEDAKSAAQCGVKVLAGLELGIPAFSAMAGIHIVKGKPTVGANLMAAKLKASGKYDYRVRKLDDEGCAIAFFQGDEEIGVSTFTKQDAAKAGTQNMQKFGRNMMFSRAMSNGVKWYTPDIFLSPTYTPEEMGVPVDGEGNVLQAEIIEPEKPAKPSQQSARANTQLPPSKAENTQAEQTPTGIGADRGAAMEQHIRERGFTDTQIAVFLASSIERNVATCAELTEREVRDVLAEVKRIEGERKKNKTDDEPPSEPSPEPLKDFDPHKHPANSAHVLTMQEAANLHRALGSIGCKDHPAFVFDTIGREVESFTELTVPESVKIFEAAVYAFGSETQIFEYEQRKAAA